MSPQQPVIESGIEPTPETSGARKAAILLMGIGEAAGISLMRQLSQNEIRLISQEIANMSAVSPEQMLRVFREFEVLSERGHFFALAGPEKARYLITQALGEKEAEQFFLPEVEVAPVRPVDPEGPFGRVEPSELAAALKEENPQTLALVLSNLPAEQAGPLLASLPDAVQPQVATRIALMDRISPEVFHQIAEAVRAKLHASKQLQRSNGTNALAAILNNMDGDKADTVLAILETENQSAAASIRQMMFVFDDIVRVDKESIRTLIGRLDRKILTTALKGTSDKIKGHFKQTMSQRSSEMLMEDMEALGPVRIRDVAAAQQQVINTLRQLEKEGVIASTGKGGEEYVV